MGLEDKPELASDAYDQVAIAALEFLALEATLLGRAEGADERKQGSFSGTRGACHDDDFATSDFESVVEERLFAQFALAKIVVQVFDLHRER